MTKRRLLGKSSTVRHPFKGWQQLYSSESIEATFKQWYPEVYVSASKRGIEFLVESSLDADTVKTTGFECSIYAIGTESATDELATDFPLEAMIRPIMWRSVSYEYLFAASQLTLDERSIICPHAVLTTASPHELLSRSDLMTGPYCLGIERGAGSMKVHCRQVADAAAIKFVFG